MTDGHKTAAISDCGRYRVLSPVPTTVQSVAWIEARNKAATELHDCLGSVLGLPSLPKLATTIAM